MLVNTKEMLLKAKENKYAIPQFNINNLEWTRFILEECENLKSPVILGVSEGASKYMGGFKVVSSMVKSLIESLNITIPVALHLDHGSSFEVCKKAIDAGFTSVMIDASKYNLEENIKITKEVVNYAKEKNVSVEAEIGHIGGNEENIKDNGIIYADSNECKVLTTKTEIDSLAPALGSAHGIYKGEPKLEFDLMKKISNKTNLPLVLHGGTGIPDYQIKEAINSGTCKLNLNTELQIAWVTGVREFLNSNSGVYDPRKIIKSGEKNIKKVIYDKINLLGSLNQA